MVMTRISTTVITALKPRPWFFRFRLELAPRRSRASRGSRRSAEACVSLRSKLTPPKVLYRGIRRAPA